MISGVVLAAGMSTRLDSKLPKQLLPLGEQVVVEQVVERLLASQVEEVVVVVGYQAKQIKSKLESWPVKLVYNPDYKLGQSTSLRFGLQELNPQADGILCMLADQPLVQVSTLNYLINQFRRGDNLIVRPKYHNQVGNPVIFAAQLKPEMMNVSGDQGARALITKYQHRSKTVAVEDKGVILDVDTRSDYRQLKEELNQN
ncbi:MAG: nucleotidyltransferase family protein [Bacillota bacterium]